MINIVGINKSFGEHKVLSDVNMALEDGKIYCLMGESGIGKTTLLRIMMGLECADSGHVDITSGNGFAAVFQEDRLILDRTPVDNVYFVTRGQKNYSDRQQIREAMCEILPKDCLEKNVSQLSGGMKRRTALARAVLSDRSVLLLDEPFTGLDAEARMQAIEFIRKYKDGRIVVVVTHEKHDADMLGADICLLTMYNSIATIV